MSWVADNRLLLLFAGVVLTTVSAVGTGVVGTLATLTTLVTGGPILALVGVTVFGSLLLVGLDIVFAVALVRELSRRASLPTHAGLSRWLARLERHLPQLSSVGLSDRFAPSVDDRRETLTRRYVDDDLSERELERELEALLDADADEDTSAITVRRSRRPESDPDPITERGRG